MNSAKNALFKLYVCSIMLFSTIYLQAMEKAFTSHLSRLMSSLYHLQSKALAVNLRLFVAFNLPKELNFGDIQKHIQNNSGVSFSPENIHLTAVFIGNPHIPIAIVKKVLHDAAKTFSTTKGTHSITGLTILKGAKLLGKKANKIVLEIQTSTLLNECVKIIKDLLNKNGIVYTAIPFKAHITLGTIKPGGMTPSLQSFLSAIQAPKGARKDIGEYFSIRSFTLYTSYGGQYFPISNVDL